MVDVESGLVESVLESYVLINKKVHVSWRHTTRRWYLVSISS